MYPIALAIVPCMLDCEFSSVIESLQSCEKYSKNASPRHKAWCSRVEMKRWGRNLCKNRAKALSQAAQRRMPLL
jgi:hypothetical protein